jgi:transcriptional regulator with XRE-family HTH domain
MNYESEKILALLNEFLNEKGVTQKNLASKLEMTQSNISKKLRGDITLSITELSQICFAAGTSIEELLEFSSIKKMNETFKYSKDQADFICSDSYVFKLVLFLFTPHTLEEVQRDFSSDERYEAEAIEQLMKLDIIEKQSDGKFKTKLHNSIYMDISSSPKYIHLLTRIFNEQHKLYLKFPYDFLRNEKHCDRFMLVERFTEDQIALISESIRYTQSLVSRFSQMNRQQLQPKGKHKFEYRVLCLHNTFVEGL